MDFRIGKNELLRGLYLTHSIADRKNTIPILANVLIRASGKDKVLFAATDIKVAMVVSGSAKVSEEGGLTIGARQLYEIVKGLGGEEVRLQRTEQNWLHLESGKTEFKVVGMNERDFPKLPSFDDTTCSKVDAVTLAEMIGKTVLSVSQDETRPHLASVLLESDGEKATMVSTDGHRLSKISCPMPGGPKLASGVLLPRKGIAEIRRVIEGSDSSCEIGIDQGSFILKLADVVLSVKLGEGMFPPYDQVIPKDNDKRLVVAREELVEALRRVSIIASDKTWGIRFMLEKGRLSIEADNPDLGNARAKVDVSYKGAALQIGFNARYFIDLLTEMKAKEVAVELGGDLDPALVKPCDDSEYLGVVMPMRL
ncbi:MAG: DNA polymerase III subunit beta [Deltaproteobacteria bacterium]|jgi:DNA polymerase-3 subunit beta|nr:DNA polymerase III subunit beta [Deltaproteobacteria bacterium]